MSSRTTLRPFIVMNNVDLSNNQTSMVTLLQSLTRIAYYLNWTGTSPVGTIAVQGSGDYSLGPNGVVYNAGNWTTLTIEYNGTNVPSVPISGNSGNGIIDLETGINALRLLYTFGSGTGNLTALVSGKVA